MVLKLTRVMRYKTVGMEEKRGSSKVVVRVVVRSKFNIFVMKCVRGLTGETRVYKIRNTWVSERAC